MVAWLDIEVAFCTIDWIYINWKVRGYFKVASIMLWLSECVSGMATEKVPFDWSNAITRIQSLTILPKTYILNVKLVDKLQRI
jgi:hypothetical protein